MRPGDCDNFLSTQMTWTRRWGWVIPCLQPGTKVARKCRLIIHAIDYRYGKLCSLIVLGPLVEVLVSIMHCAALVIMASYAK